MIEMLFADVFLLLSFNQLYWSSAAVEHNIFRKSALSSEIFDWNSKASNNIQRSEGKSNDFQEHSSAFDVHAESETLPFQRSLSPQSVDPDSGDSTNNSSKSHLKFNFKALPSLPSIVKGIAAFFNRAFKRLTGHYHHVENFENEYSKLRNNDTISGPILSANFNIRIATHFPRFAFGPGSSLPPKIAEYDGRRGKLTNKERFEEKNAKNQLGLMFTIRPGDEWAQSLGEGVRSELFVTTRSVIEQNRSKINRDQRLIRSKPNLINKIEQLSFGLKRCQRKQEEGSTIKSVVEDSNHERALHHRNLNRFQVTSISNYKALNEHTHLKPRSTFKNSETAVSNNLEPRSKGGKSALEFYQPSKNDMISETIPVTQEVEENTATQLVSLPKEDLAKEFHLKRNSKIETYLSQLRSLDQLCSFPREILDQYYKHKLQSSWFLKNNSKNDMRDLEKEVLWQTKKIEKLMDSQQQLSPVTKRLSECHREQMKLFSALLENSNQDYLEVKNLLDFFLKVRNFKKK